MTPGLLLCAAPSCGSWEVSVLLTPICTTELTLATLAQSTGFDIFLFDSHQKHFLTQLLDGNL